MLEEALSAPGEAGRIIVTTQVVEAGVDISAATLFTDLAPWSSLVQRFGRCNRTGELEDARIFWLDAPCKTEQAARPYTPAALARARALLSGLEDAAPALLPRSEDRDDAHAVLRAPDLFDLFDTTPDLAGADIDVSRFIRESDDTDVQAFWRTWPGDMPGGDMPGPAREELCPVPLGEMRDFLKDKRQHAWVWDSLEGHWQEVRRLRPGMVVLLRDTAGGYAPHSGPCRTRHPGGPSARPYGTGQRHAQPCRMAKPAGTRPAHPECPAGPALGSGRACAPGLSARPAHRGTAA